MTKSNHNWIIPIILILLGFTARLLPHPANFAPIAAIALFGGMYLPKKLGLLLPLLALFASDIIIGTYNPKIMILVYGSFIAMGLIGLWAKKNKTFARIVGGTLLGSIIFFITTNAGVWAFGTMYTHDLSGLIQSYTMALPFFRNTLLGNFFYVAILVGSAEYLLQKLPEIQPQKV